MKVTCPCCKRRIRLHKSRKILCPGCGAEFKYTEYFHEQSVYLVDTNIILYAINNDRHKGSACRGVFNSGMPLGTTNTCLAEVSQDIPYHLKVYTLKALTPAVSDLRATTLKQPSLVDLSLIQVAIDHPEIKGIITYDRDFHRIAAGGIVSRGQETTFWVGDAQLFLERRVKRFALGKTTSSNT
ncbi:MAG: hypothetical protein JW840_02995 [Candidatus Thermoplasmatota archaeon]|nr:hypothetical protein [Candidatus Thermoplasmatota archaeon]